ncbi:MAG TPA: hypothetical protein VD838_11960, partial [Anaeromyxobacteraceae bacterium]|nr:hypothetical protein [Anaeromyxobacteraceae bacterium]
MLQRTESSEPPSEAVLGVLPAGIAVVDGVTLTVRWANAAFLGLLDERARAAGAAGLPLDAVPPRAAALAERVRHAVATGENA